MASWRPLGGLWGPRARNVGSDSPSGAPLGAFLGLFGAVLEASGAFLGPCGGLLWSSRGDLGNLVGRLGRWEGRKVVYAKSARFLNGI